MSKLKLENMDDRTYLIGSSLKGHLIASFADIKEVLGEPAFEGKGDKITTEWVVRWEDEEEDTFGYFSIYDWRYARDFNDDYSKIEWNIGGKSFDDWIASDEVYNKIVELRSV